jgi:hypothetical protein
MPRRHLFKARGFIIREARRSKVKLAAPLRPGQPAAEFFMSGGMYARSARSNAVTIMK